MSKIKASHTYGLVVLIVVLLTALAVLQYRWIGELSSFQRQQMERTLRASTSGLMEDLEDDFEDLWGAFLVRERRDPGREVAEDYREWRERTDFAQLIEAVYWVTDEPDFDDRVTAREDRLRIARVSLDSGEMNAVAWPAELAALRAPLVESSDSHGRRDFHESDSFTALPNDDVLAFVVAQTRVEPNSWAVVVLRRDVLAETVLPALVDEHFGSGDARSYDVQIFDEAAADRMIYSSVAAQTIAAPPEPDFTRHFRSFGGFFRSRADGGGRTLAIAVTHRAGSLETAVAQLRRRNLGYSFGVVLVLAASIGVLAVAARRARRLASRQMEFVAGVSHELRTPISGISSLGQNLADGVVDNPDQVARYGDAIHKASRRLANMVEGVLHYSAIRSDRYRYDSSEVDTGRLLESAVETLDPVVLDRISLAVDAEKDLPPLLGDERALQSMVRNLVSNAMKFSTEGGEIRLSARLVDRERHPRIELCVVDQGTGIDADELEHIFEPFFRGRAAQNGQVEGSGIGLSLVKEVVDAHGGHIDVRSAAGSGTTFRVILPTAPRVEATRPEQAAAVDPMPATGSGGDA